jgi:S-(hydroxymethyl)mycothiol dehydrogenase
VAGADLSRRRLDTARACGAVDLCFDTRQKPLTDWVKDLGEHGAELVVDAVGLTASITSCIRGVAPRGRVVLLGSPREKMEIDPYNDIHSPGVQIIGAHVGVVDASVRARDRILVSRYLGEGRIRVDPLITHHAGLDEAQTVYDGLRDKPDVYIGVIFRYD